jgi:opacity protein-like surface antigen
MFALLPAAVAAQDPPPPDPIEQMPIRFGPLGIKPAFAISNVGVDSNVFSNAENPQEDFTATIEPRLQARLRLGRVLLSYGATAGFVYYQEFSDEGGLNANTDVRLDANLGRLQPYVAAAWLDTKERLNAEVDRRAPRHHAAYSTGVRMLLASRSALIVNARYADVEFDEGVTFRGVELARTLNSRVETIDGGLQLLLTPLTTFTLGVSLQRDRFEAEPERDSDTVRVLPTFQFDPTALLRGSVAVGYRGFRPLSDALPDYSGLIVQTTLGYTLLGRTKFDVDVQRDVQYSYEQIEPYYLNTGARLTVTHQMVGPLDVQGTGGRQQMAYRAAAVEGETRTDRADTLGAGVGVRLRENIRIGVNWEWTRRTSVLPNREYERRRVFASLLYGS